MGLSRLFPATLCRREELNKNAACLRRHFYRRKWFTVLVSNFRKESEFRLESDSLLVSDFLSWFDRRPE
jgi:hypothetical protein